MARLSISDNTVIPFKIQIFRQKVYLTLRSESIIRILLKKLTFEHGQTRILIRIPVPQVDEHALQKIC